MEVSVRSNNNPKILLVEKLVGFFSTKAIGQCVTHNMVSSCYARLQDTIGLQLLQTFDI